MDSLCSHTYDVSRHSHDVSGETYDVTSHSHDVSGETQGVYVQPLHEESPVRDRLERPERAADVASDERRGAVGAAHPALAVLPVRREARPLAVRRLRGASAGAGAAAKDVRRLERRPPADRAAAGVTPRATAHVDAHVIREVGVPLVEDDRHGAPSPP